MKRNKSNQSGFVVVDFLFAMFVSFGLIVILMSMMFTLSIVEVGQYIAFSASRAQSAGHVSMNEQKLMAYNKYKELTSNKNLKTFFSNGWFEISKPEQIEIKSGNGDSFDREFGDEAEFAPFIGVRFDLKAHVLNIKFPMLGSQDDDNFSLKLSSFLIREPSSEECQKFMEDRYQGIMDLDSRFNTVKDSSNKYVPMEDNGC